MDSLQARPPSAPLRPLELPAEERLEKISRIETAISLKTGADGNFQGREIQEGWGINLV